MMKGMKQTLEMSGVCREGEIPSAFSGGNSLALPGDSSDLFLRLLTFHTGTRQKMRPSVLPGVTWHTVSPPSGIKAAGKDSTSKYSAATKSSIVWGQLPGLSTRQCQGREMIGRIIENI